MFVIHNIISDSSWGRLGREHMQSLVWNQEFGNLFGLSKHFKAKKCSVTSKQFVRIRRIVISSDNHTNVSTPVNPE